MRICIFGAGAVGSHFAVRLALAGHDVSCVMRGPHLEAVKSKGLTLRVDNTEVSARAGCLAPRFCPTSVAAALLRPHDGRMTKMMIRIAIVYPARAAEPKVLTMRTSPIQLVCAMVN